MSATDHKRVTPEGRSIGFQTARLCEPAVHDLVTQGESDERCKSCAGTYGTVPNGCMQTQMDFTKALAERVPFMCHQADRRGQLCHAWYAASVSIKEAEVRKGHRAPTVECPWDFSEPDVE